MFILCTFYRGVWRCCHVQILSYLNTNCIGINPIFAIIFNILGFLQQKVRVLAELGV
ncbi:hypothetical protein [Caudoviricetes sp.]|nr:hypothetical protein [Caudoviricetes sp.]